MTRELLCELGYEDSIVFDGLDAAIVAISTDGIVIYSYTAMIEIFCTRDGMTEEEAIEYIEFNILRLPPCFEGRHMPIVVYGIEDLI